MELSKEVDNVNNPHHYAGSCSLECIEVMKVCCGLEAVIHFCLCNAFKYMYHMNRVGWFAYADNPAVKGYRSFIEKHGGRECAYLRQVAKLTDGKLHDAVEFEILAEEFHK